MLENEYSFQVKDLKPYIDYCLNNNYELTESSNQTRVIYRNTNKTIARITTKETNGLTTKYLDFKDDILSNDILITRRETLPIEITDEEAINSILDFLKYKKDNTLTRKRLIYSKDKVKFELDEYLKPNKHYVVALEGDLEKIKPIYEEIKSLMEGMII